MIQIQVERKDKIDSVTVKGHAGYGVRGTDIVCASVSSILITTVNAILRVDENSIQVDQADAYVKVTILKRVEMVNLLMENMVALLEELQTDYKKYIRITNEEV